MRRFLYAVAALFGVSGSARAARHIGKLEKISTKLNDAVSQIESEISSEWQAIGREKAAFEAKIGERSAVQAQRSSDKDRALRVALRMSSLVS